MKLFLIFLGVAVIDLSKKNITDMLYSQLRGETVVDLHLGAAILRSTKNNKLDRINLFDETYGIGSLLKY